MVTVRESFNLKMDPRLGKPACAASGGQLNGALHVNRRLANFSKIRLRFARHQTSKQGKQ